jgi:hypothetical protein
MLSDFRKTYLHMVKTGLMSQKKAQKGKVQIERESFRKSEGKQRVLIFQGALHLAHTKLELIKHSTIGLKKNNVKQMIETRISLI